MRGIISGFFCKYRKVNYNTNIQKHSINSFESKGNKREALWTSNTPFEFDIQYIKTSNYWKWITLTHIWNIANTHERNLLCNTAGSCSQQPGNNIAKANIKRVFALTNFVNL